MAVQTILFMASNPAGTDARALDEQAHAVQVELERAGLRECFKLETRWAAQPLDLLRELVKLKPTVVHFCGGRIAGAGDTARAAGIYFQGSDGYAHLVPATALAEAFDAAGGSVKLVVLDACYSEAHAEAVAAHIDCVVGMVGETNDAAAMAFAIGLYGGLGEGESVAAAFKQGCAAIGMTGAGDPDQPRLRVRPGVDASQLVLTEPSLAPPSPTMVASAVPATAPHAPVLALVRQSPALGTHTFIGREHELNEIGSLLTGTSDVQLRAALDGLPGIGKTELARQVVGRLAQGTKFPGGIFWFNADHPDLRLQWAELVEDPGHVLPDVDARARWAVRQVEQRAQQGAAVLIVLDNVETWEPRPGPLPDVAAIRMLVTTRTRWLHNSFRAYEVPPLDLEPARALLRVIVGHEVEGADDLLAALGGHVLSIELAATYLREYGTPSADYLRQLVTGQSPGSSVADQTSYRATAESAFRLLWNRVSPDVRQAWIQVAQLPPTWFSSELGEAIGLDVERRRALVRLHLLDRDNQGRHHMHRLLREFALAEAPPSEFARQVMIQKVTELLLAKRDQTRIFVAYRRDADSFAHLAAAAGDTPVDASLRVLCGESLRQLGDLPAARQLVERALASTVKTYGEDHPEVATVRSNLSYVLHDLGKLSAARQLLEQVLASVLNTYEEDHSAVAVIRSNLARVLHDLGELSTARQLLELVLAWALKTYGEDHLTVATFRSNLGRVLQDLGEYPTARQLFEKALESDLKTYGEDHPRVAIHRNNLANLLHCLGELLAARQLLELALASALNTFGEGHPTVAIRRNNLGLVLHDLGNLSAARNLFEQALKSDLKTLGEAHPYVATRRNNLGLVLKDLGELPAARQLFVEGLASHLKTYGEDHPEVATFRHNLGLVLKGLGKPSAARQLLEQALASNLKTFGEDHPTVMKGRESLAWVLKDLGELSAVRQLLEQALASALKFYSKDHPRVVEISNKLAKVQRIADSNGPSPHDFAALQSQQRRPEVRSTDRVGRNEPCPCGSGKKYKRCCGL